MQVSPPYTDCDILGQTPQLPRSSGTVRGWMRGCGHHLLEPEMVSEAKDYSTLNTVFRNIQDYFAFVSLLEKMHMDGKKDS